MGLKLVIAGGGLAGTLVAIALSLRRPEIDLLLLEQQQGFGGNHVWSFFDSDVPAGAEWLVERLGRRRWPDHEVRFPECRRVISTGYNSVRSSDLDIAARTLVPPGRWRLGCPIKAIEPGLVQLESGERIKADAIIDARGACAAPALDLGWQKFVGRLYQCGAPHGVERPVIMDATVPQHDGFRFVYLLPFSATELLVEDTYYSSSPLLDQQRIGERIGSVLAGLALSRPLLSGEEHGVLPVVIQGALEDLWPAQDHRPRIGLRGGFFHPTTGYSLSDALANASLIAGARDLSEAGLARLLRGRAEQLWRERGFYQLLNRMLFRAARPDQRYRVLEHFYRLPDEVVQRFYAARLRPLDKALILSGRPPVPLLRAFGSLRRRAS